jgi:hypothetical protein
MSKTREAMEKLSNKSRETLEAHSALIAIGCENGDEQFCIEHAKTIRGYLKCLLDLELITRSDLQALYLYYYTNGNKFR